jgi:hypothetical protein
MVVQDARDGELAGPGAAAEVGRALEHRDVDAVLGEPDRGREAVRSGAHHDRRGHRTAAADPGAGATAAASPSVSWALVASRILIPRAASITLCS